MRPSTRQSAEPTLSAPRLHIADRLDALNDGVRIEHPGIQIDPGAMLVLSLGNPTHFRFAIEGSEQDVSFTVSQKNTTVANARLYRDPQRGGGYFRPDVKQEFRNLGLGILSYLTAGRIALLLWGEDLHSNSQQLSPSAEGLWTSLTEQHLAIQRGPKDFSLHRFVAESEGAARLLGTLLKMRSNGAHLAESAHYVLPAAEPDDLRSNLSGHLRPYDYWLHTDASFGRVRAGAKDRK